MFRKKLIHLLYSQCFWNRQSFFTISLLIQLVLTNTIIIHSSFASLVKNEYKLALVIGNSHYQSSPLKNPVNDANDISQKLRALGFEVILKKDADQQQMIKAIRDFGRKLREKRGVGLFYFAGHGIQVQGDNYLIPIGADILEEDEIIYESVNVNRVLEKIDRASGRVNVVILDACRNNPFERSFRSASRGLAQMRSPSGTLIAFATEPGSVAMDGTGRNGIYTQYLLKHMDDKNIDISRMFRKVRSDVMKQTQDSQIPWESSSLTGDFYFNPPKKTYKNNQQLNHSSSSVKSKTNAIELAFWHSIEKSNKAEFYKAYIESFPNGVFVPLAKLKIKNLNKGLASNQSVPNTAPSPSSSKLAKISSAPKQHLLDSNLKLDKSDKITETIRVEPELNKAQQKKIHLLLVRAEQSVAEKRLTTPQQTSALHYYSQVLSLQADNAKALNGMDKIINQYLLWAKNAMATHNFSLAKTYIERAEQVNPQAESVIELRHLLQKQQINAIQRSPLKKSKFPGSSVLVALPANGSYENKKYPHSGKQTAQIIVDILSPYFHMVTITKKLQSRHFNLALARNRNMTYLVIAVIKHWEDRSTTWSGRPDKVSIQLSVIKVSSGKTIDSHLFELSSEWSFAASSSKPEELLNAPLKKYFSSLKQKKKI